jgi:hypothetical protein
MVDSDSGGRGPGWLAYIAARRRPQINGRGVVMKKTKDIGERERKRASGFMLWRLAV